MQMGLIKVLREILVIQKKVEADPPDHQPLKGFSFNESLKLDQCLQFPLIVSQTINSEITITIPQINPIQSISTPAGTSRVTIQALAIAFSFEHKNSFCEVAEPVTIAYTENMFPATVITLETPEKSPGMVLVVLSLTYWNKGRKITDNGYTPLQVIEVFNG